MTNKTNKGLDLKVIKNWAIEYQAAHKVYTQAYNKAEVVYQDNKNIRELFRSILDQRVSALDAKQDIKKLELKKELDLARDAILASNKELMEELKNSLPELPSKAKEEHNYKVLADLSELKNNSFVKAAKNKLMKQEIARLKELKKCLDCEEIAEEIQDLLCKSCWVVNMINNYVEKLGEDVYKYDGYTYTLENLEEVINDEFQNELSEPQVLEFEVRNEILEMLKK